MRKFIIKYWFGQYAWKRFVIDRAGVYNTILMIIAILVNVFIENQTIAIPLMLLPVSILVFTTFIYLQRFPVKWHELDIKQKHYYGFYYTTELPNFAWPKDFKENYDEWVEIDKTMKI